MQCCLADIKSNIPYVLGLYWKRLASTVLFLIIASYVLLQFIAVLFWCARNDLNAIINRSHV